MYKNGPFGGLLKEKSRYKLDCNMTNLDEIRILIQGISLKVNSYHKWINSKSKPCKLSVGTLELQLVLHAFSILSCPCIILRLGLLTIYDFLRIPSTPIHKFHEQSRCPKC